MTNRNIPADAITRSFFWVGTAHEVAQHLNRRYGGSLTASSLKAEWVRQAETNIVMRECGERPAGGFEQTETIQLAARIAA